jgi:ATP-dependent DNA helicase RecG
MRLEDDIKTVKGIGDKTAQNFNKLGIYNIKDLVFYYPRSYKTYSEPVPVSSVTEGDRVAVFCRVVTYVESHKGRRYNITSLTAADDTGSIRMVWFNMPFLRNLFKKGDSYIFYGIIKIKGNMRVMEMPEYFTQIKYQKALSTMQPIYPLKSGVTNNSITRAIEAVKDVVLSKRLSDSPCCVVIDENDPSIQMERMMRAMGQGNASLVKPILEINGDHPLVKKERMILLRISLDLLLFISSIILIIQNWNFICC